MSIRSIMMAGASLALATVGLADRAPSRPKRPAKKRHKAKATKRVWFPDMGGQTAEKYVAKRAFHPGTSSTLRKTQKAFRIAGRAMEPTELRRRK